MHIFEFIRSWPQFIQYIIKNDIVLFGQIVQLTQTCAELRTYFHGKFKAYAVICQYQCKKVNMSVFSKPELFYSNSFERELFYKMCYPQLYRTDLSLVVLCNSTVVMDLYNNQYNYCIERNLINPEKFNDAVRIAVENNNINMLDKLLQFGYTIYGTCSLINLAANNGYVECLEWFYNTSLKYPNIVTFEYTEDAIDQILFNHVKVLNWFIGYSLKSDTPLKYSERAIDNASVANYINVLNWFLEQNLTNGLEIKYTINAMDNAAKRGLINVLYWWFDSGLELKYSKCAVNGAACNNNIEILNWFLNLHLCHNQPFKYSKRAVDTAAGRGYIRILDWFYTQHVDYNFPFKYSEKAVDHASQNAYIEVLNWFYNHSDDTWLTFNRSHAMIDIFPKIEFKYSKEAFKINSITDNHHIVIWWKNLELMPQN